MSKVDFVTGLETLTCPGCGMLFAAPEHWVESRRKKHDTFYCPNGHSQGFYGPSAHEKKIAELEVQVEQQKRRIKWADEGREAAHRRAELEKRRAAAARGQITKIKKRVGSGVCPCCNRTFANLARHMSGQHPDWNHESEAESRG